MTLEQKTLFGMVNSICKDDDGAQARRSGYTKVREGTRTDEVIESGLRLQLLTAAHGTSRQFIATHQFGRY
jgi:hypothetical protein